MGNEFMWLQRFRASSIVLTSVLEPNLHEESTRWSNKREIGTHLNFFLTE
jgi:hypothetical protein